MRIIQIALCITTVSLGLFVSGCNDNKNANSTTNTGDAGDFEIATIILEQNATDGDAEVVVIAKGGDEGMVRFSVTDPNGRVVYAVDAGQSPINLGGREFIIESPEPTNTQIVLDAFPEGAYTFEATTISGALLRGTPMLSQTFANPVEITNPVENSTVAREDVVINWSAVSNVDHYIVEMKVEFDDGTEQTLAVTVDSSTTQFIPPQEWLIRGMEYQVAVGTFAIGGNTSFVEIAFLTAP